LQGLWSVKADRPDWVIPDTDSMGQNGPNGTVDEYAVYFQVRRRLPIRREFPDGAPGVVVKSLRYHIRGGLLLISRYERLVILEVVEVGVTERLEVAPVLDKLMAYAVERSFSGS